MSDHCRGWEHSNTEVIHRHNYRTATHKYMEVINDQLHYDGDK